MPLRSRRPYCGPPAGPLSLAKGWPSRRTPSATSSDREVARRSRRTRTTVPSSSSRTMSSLASERCCHPCQSARSFCQIRLTVSLPTIPPTLRQAQERRQRPSHTPRVGPGQIGPGDQRLGLPRQTPVGRQHLTAPLLRRARCRPHAGPRHRHADRAEGPHQLPLAVAS